MLTQKQNIIYQYLLDNSKNRVSSFTNDVLSEELAQHSFITHKGYITTILQALERRGKISIKTEYLKMTSGKRRTITIL